MFPPCFESQEQFDEWIELAEYTGVAEPEKNYCFDCTPLYQRLAIEQNICSRPDAFFVPILEEEWADEISEVEVVGITTDMIN